MSKLLNSIKTAFVMVLARKYGKYIITVGGYEYDIFVSYHVYEYKGNIYHFPAVDTGKD
jgi:hypothetical protein